MVDEKSLPNLSPGVNFDPGKETADMRNQTREKRDTPVPQRMSQAMKLPGMETGIGKKDLPGILGCRIVLKYRLHVLFDVADKPHNCYPSSTRATA
jgi:hypothetical protein